MRKNLAPMECEKPPRIVRPWLIVRLIFATMAIATPFLYESGLIC